MKRIWHRYEKWEDLGMWINKPKELEDELFVKAVEFTGNAELYGSYMMRVVQEYPIACEHNLTASGINKKAWVGHAAAWMAIGCPEHITRKAWRELTEEQQDEANDKAQQAIEWWNEAKNKSLHKNMEGKGL